MARCPHSRASSRWSSARRQLDDEGNPRSPFVAGDIPNVQKAGTSGRVNEGQTVLTNGVNVGGRGGTPAAPEALEPGAKTLDVQAGQGLRLRLGNETVVRFFRLILTDNAGNQIPLVRVGGQGGILDRAIVEGGVVGGFDFKFGSGELLLDPGDRQDVVVAIPPSATGVLTLWTQDFDRTGAGFAGIPTVPVAHFRVTGTAPSTYTIGAGTALLASLPGQAVETLGPPTGTLLDPSTFTPPKTGLSSQNIRLTQAGISSLGVDDKLGHHEFAGDYKDVAHEESARYAKLGDTLELTVENTTQAHHPFHLHGFSIQPVELTRPGSPTYTWPYREFRDNVDIPKGYTLRYRVRLDDRPLMDGVTPGGGLGRWVFHCHIFFHAAFGMISEFDVVAPTGNERPYVNADTTSVAVDEGEPAAMTGTFKDPDGDAVTLSASLGTVTKNDSGSWSWSYPTTDEPQESQLVYITATDPDGQKDQAVFSLTVDINDAPGAAGDTYATDEDTELNVAAPGVLANDTDRDGDDLAATLVSGPGDGTLELNEDGSLSYTPHQNFNGSDSFSYRASDGELDSDPATVTIDVGAVADTPPAGPAGTPPAGTAPPPGQAAPAEPAIAQLRLRPNCVRRSRTGRVRIRMTLRRARPAPLQIHIERAVGTGARRSCPGPNHGRRFTGRFREIATTRPLPTRPAATAAALGRRITLKPRLTAGLYRITVRAQLDGNRLSRPVRRYLRVLG